MDVPDLFLANVGRKIVREGLNELFWLSSAGSALCSRPSRLALQQLELDVSGLRAVSINVWRNHAIEPVIALALPYLAYARYLADFHLSDYDDTLMFSGRQPADIELLWLDSSRYLDHSRFDDWLDWLIGRMEGVAGPPTPHRSSWPLGSMMPDSGHSCRL